MATATATITMSLREADRLKTIQALADRMLRLNQAAHRQLAPGLADRAVALIRERYADFGPTLATEKLSECHGLVLGKETRPRDAGAAGFP